MKADLRLTDTNAASDSSGRTWGLDGNLIWWLIGGLGVGIAIFFVMIVAFKAGLLVSFGVAVVPLFICVGYILTLRQGKPPGYDRDVLERLFAGNGFSPDIALRKHPLVGNQL